jgi:alkaline phosphatase
MRIRVIACLLIFLSFSAISNAQEKELKHQKPKNVIIMVGDGMGIAQTYAAYTANNGFLNMFLLPFTGISLTYSYDNYITDSAAGATAFSCGQKTNNKSLGKDSTGKDIKNIFEIAKKNKLSTGFAVTCAITHATPAAFYAHNVDRNQYDTIALDFLSGSVDVAIGGGKRYFSERKDGQNLINKLKKSGYKFYENIDSINCVTDCKVLCLPASKDLPKMSGGRGDYLSKAVDKAIEVLSKDKEGFIFMVEGSQIDWGNHINNIDYVTSETLDFDKAVGVALKFAKQDSNTLVIVTADHESGGLTITGGNLAKGTVFSDFSSINHTAIPVMVYSYGPGAELFTGVYQNTAIFYKMVEALGLK